VRAFTTRYQCFCAGFGFTADYGFIAVYLRPHSRYLRLHSRLQLYSRTCGYFWGRALGRTDMASALGRCKSLPTPKARQGKARTSSHFSCILPVYCWTNKKSELMLMRCARAHGSSCSQLILVYLHPFRCTSVFCSQKSHRITKILYFLRLRSSMLIPLTSTSPLLVMII